MEDIIILGILIFIVCAAVYYIVKSKKKGIECIGCPHAQHCGGKCAESCRGKEKRDFYS